MITNVRVISLLGKWGGAVNSFVSVSALYCTLLHWEASLRVNTGGGGLGATGANLSDN